MSPPAPNPGRWTEIERLYHAALEWKAEEREGLLRTACGGDDALFQEVCSLLRFDRSSFLQTPPLDVAARLYSPESLVGQSLNQYTVIRLIGTGGMGEVYLAADSRLGREVAIKVLPRILAKNPEALERFEREARAIASLSHPNVLGIHDFGTDQDITYAVTELLEGETLAERLKRGPLDWRKTIEIGIAVAEGLAAAHARGITHRDLKPANIFITSDNRVKVLDFGIARISPVSSLARGSEGAAVTEPGRLIGTAGYMSPEQVRGEDVDASSDLFALGCVLYEMLAGCNPFLRGSGAETMAAILKDEPVALPLEGDDLPAALATIVGRCLEKKPANRYASAAEVSQRLKDVLAGHAEAIPALARAQRKSPRHLFMVGAALIVLTLSAALWLERPGPPAALPPVRSIAVLPFRPLIGAADEALQFGMTDTLIMRLSNIREIVVRPITAVRRYSGTDQNPLSAGEEQDVDAVLEGSMQRVGDRIRVTARLLRVDDGSALWAEQFDENSTDIFSLQDRISTKVAAALSVRLSAEENALLRKHHTLNSEAYRLYQLGRFHWDKRTPDQVLKAIDYFEDAIAIDSSYALAYTGMADSYTILGSYGALPAPTAFPKAKEYAEKALRMDERLAEAHVSLAATLTDYYWDWTGAEREFRRAIELQPNNVVAHYWYGGVLSLMGRFEEAELEMRRALEIDPLSVITRGSMGSVYYRARRYDAALKELRHALEMDPSFLPLHLNLGLVYMQTQQYQDAIHHLLKVEELAGGTTPPGALGMAYALSGSRSDAMSVLKRLLSPSGSAFVSPIDIALVYVGLGDHDRAFEWLEQAYGEREWRMGLLKVDPGLDSLRKDPRFSSLLQRMGIP